MAMKGQVTIFIAVGLLVLIVVGLGAYMLNYRNVEFSSDIKEAEEIHELISQCLELNSEELLIIAGLNGGWVNPEDANLIPNPTATKSNFVVYTPSIIPYWHYLEESSSKSSQPPLCKSSNCVIDSYGRNSIEDQLEYYIGQKMINCADLSDYSSRVDIERGVMSVDVEFGRESVIVRLDWPHKLKANNKEESFSEFIVSHDVPFVNLYELSELIVDSERYNSYFSKQLMSMITLYSGIDEQLPPLSDVKFSVFGGEKIWTVPLIKQEISNQIIPLSALYQVRTTDNFKQADFRGDNSLFEEGIYSGFDLDYGESYDFDGIKAYFKVPLVEPEIRINAGSQIVKGEKLTGPADFVMKILGLGITRYKTTYSVSYPLVVELENEEAFDGKGFRFVSGFEVNVFSNQPAIAEFEGFEEDLINYGEGIKLAYRDGTDFTIRVVSEKSGEGVGNFTIIYSCGEEYPLGITGRDGILVTEMPYCATGGTVSAFNPDYSEVIVPYNHDGQEDKLEIRSWPIQLKEFKLLTNKIQLSPEGVLTEPLADYEFGMAILEPINETWPSVQVATYGDGQVLLNQLQTQYEEEQVGNFSGTNNTLQIIPGDYKVTIIITHNEPITVPKDEQGGILGFGEEEIPAKTFQTWPHGGATFTATFHEEAVYSDKPIILYAEEKDVTGMTWRNIQTKTFDESNQNSNLIGWVLEE